MPRPITLTLILAHLGLVLIGLGASTAEAAVTFTAVTYTTGGRPLDSLLVGDEFTLDIRMSSTGTPAVRVVGAAVFGYHTDVVEFQSGNAVDGFLYDSCVPTVGCFSGIQNLRAGALAETDLPSSIGRHVRFAEGNSLSGKTATGALDPGLDGSVSDAQFRVTFRMLAVGTTSLNVGTSTDPAADLFVFLGDGPDPEQATNAVLTVSVIPEPGTAILMGLGLAGLAASGRRSAVGGRRSAMMLGNESKAVRLASFLLAAIATCWVTSTATANVAFTATASAARPLDALEIGDEVTLDIRISSTGSPGVVGVGAAVQGYDPELVDFVSGQAVEYFLHEICFPGVGCFNGLEQGGSTFDPAVLTEGMSPYSGPYVQIANSYAGTPRSGTGAMSPGLDDVIGGGDAQFRVRFRALGLGTTRFDIGTNSSDPYLGNWVVISGGVLVEATNAFVTIHVVPEPGSLVLLGLGLAGLAASGRRG